jgi:hypothetical protein
MLETSTNGDVLCQPPSAKSLRGGVAAGEGEQPETEAAGWQRYSIRAG